MTHVKVPPMPGIIGLLMGYPETAKHLNGLAGSLLSKETLKFNMAERETLASYISYLNGCVFCSESHAAVANMHWGSPVAKSVWESPAHAPITDCFRALLTIAEKVQRDGKLVTEEDVKRAKCAGATDEDIHDAVLITAAFCMYNRYVDGLGTWQPPRSYPFYEEVGRMLKEQGYVEP